MAGALIGHRQHRYEMRGVRRDGRGSGPFGVSLFFRNATHRLLCQHGGGVSKYVVRAGLRRASGDCPAAAGGGHRGGSGGGLGFCLRVSRTGCGGR
jgi:hypothetical protein